MDFVVSCATDTVADHVAVCCGTSNNLLSAAHDYVDGGTYALTGERHLINNMVLSNRVYYIVCIYIYYYKFLIYICTRMHIVNTQLF